MKDRKYIYLSNKEYDGTIFKTQIVEWLHLFEKHNICFDLFQTFYLRYFFKPKYIKNQLTQIKKSTSLFKGFLFCFPSKGIFLYFNVFLFCLVCLKYLFKYKTILIFSRGLYGREIYLLKKLFPGRIIFYFDSRALAAEEHKYTAGKTGNFSFSMFKFIARVSFIEYKTLTEADKVFSVSNALKNYFIDNYKMDGQNFVLYPCLSDTDFFFYKEEIRKEEREKLKFFPENKVFVYAGGLDSVWHLTKDLFLFFDNISKLDSDCRFLLLTKDKIVIDQMIVVYPCLKDKLICMSVENDQVYRYLNAADFGILFRENTIMNNVASPTKFAEYVLCGLPVLISEGVGDYTEFCKEHKVGIVIRGLEWNGFADYDAILSAEFSRESIAETGLKYLSKESHIDSIISQF